jgi:hypothetical protein
MKMNLRSLSGIFSMRYTGHNLSNGIKQRGQLSMGLMCFQLRREKGDGACECANVGDHFSLAISGVEFETT